ncbi:hypothetical protein SASPL_142836 [Salvia splendens]|uniref:Uncharacterized protein n=1 Tax=Salvia splendens TaxID=180675 RepID=A0A8X8WL13_SALSN|nr:hypothetical protein SASPL_142836 [Salvia splendens]
MKAKANSSTCYKHPFSPSPPGICPHCLSDRLLDLVCSDCGQRRASDCSCSQTLFHRNSCSNADVGRMSFLIDSDKRGSSSLRRSTSNSAGLKKGGGFSRIKELFGKRRRSGQNLEFCDGFRDDDDDDEDEMELDRFCVYPIKERDLGFIEVKVDSWCEDKRRRRRSRASASDDGEFEIVGSLRASGVSGSSCRITMSERERGLKQRSRSSKLWKWIFKNRAAADGDDDHAEK